MRGLRRGVGPELDTLGRLSASEKISIAGAARASQLAIDPPGGDLSSSPSRNPWWSRFSSADTAIASRLEAGA